MMSHGFCYLTLVHLHFYLSITLHRLCMGKIFPYGIASAPAIPCRMCVYSLFKVPGKSVLPAMPALLADIGAATPGGRGARWNVPCPPDSTHYSGPTWDCKYNFQKIYPAFCPIFTHYSNFFRKCALQNGRKIAIL